MRTRTIATLAAAGLGLLLLATPAHATPVPSPSPSPSPTTTAPADPCALPSPTATLQEIPQVDGKTLDMRGRPRLPLPVACFVTIKDLCEGESQVTLHNPIPHIVIKYRPMGSKCGDTCRHPTQSQAHCSVCHLTFGGVSGFDEHRSDGWCVEPAALGFEERDGIWRWPLREEGFVQRRRLAAEPLTPVQGETGGLHA